MLYEDRDKYKKSEQFVDGRYEYIIRVSSITKDVIYEALKQCENGKSPGPGSILIRLITNGPDITIEQFIDFI